MAELHALDAGSLLAGQAAGTLAKVDRVGEAPATRMCELQALVSIASSLAALAILLAECTEGGVMGAEGGHGLPGAEGGGGS
jgi:hypothetical protein